ncbi:hypothetical protein HanRHA438_Chr01g0030921 [Helianthus annuus]|nr:hypothetical protein HanRHA438_Chr01g0030921 [Helianthus annuus]
MAQREGECFLVRRVADRGIDKNIGDSRARGEDRSPVRRTADRGNDKADSEPRDLKIKRIRQRVRDLELQNEIRQLKQRIRDLEDSSSWKETEPEEPVGDELSDDEEHPTNDDTIYDSPPVFDEYGDEEWYSWVIGGTYRNFAGVESDSKILNVEVVIKDDGGMVNIDGDVVANGAVTTGGDDYVERGEPDLGVPICEPTITGKSLILGSPISFKIRIKDDIGVSEFPNKPTDCSNNNSLFQDDGAPCESLFICGLHGKSHEGLNLVMGPQVYNDKVDMGLFVNVFFDNLLVDCGLQDQMVRNDYKGPITTTLVEINSLTSKISKINCLVEVELFELVKSIANNKRPDVPFDPGGTSAESGETIRKVKLFWWVVMIIDRNRTDVPFDPGGFGLKTKLEDEFFLKRGSMMQGISFSIYLKFKFPILSFYLFSISRVFRVYCFSAFDLIISKKNNVLEPLWFFLSSLIINRS